VDFRTELVERGVPKNHPPEKAKQRIDETKIKKYNELSFRLEVRYPTYIGERHLLYLILVVVVCWSGGSKLFVLSFSSLF